MIHQIDQASNDNPYKNKGIRRIIKAGGYSLKGLQAAWTGEAAFRQECMLAVAFLATLTLFDVSSMERIVLVLVTVLVLVVELLNSAIEAVVDRISLQHHPLAGQAKDIGSAAVFVSLFLWLYVCIEVFWL